MTIDQVDIFVTDNSEIRLVVTNTGFTKSKINLVTAEYLFTIDDAKEFIELIQESIDAINED